MSENKETETPKEQSEDQIAESVMADENLEEEAAVELETTPEDVIAALETEVTNLKDQLLRALAETQNLRRRADRERSDAANYAITKFARDMISVGDNLSRALTSLPENIKLEGEIKTLVEGVEMTDRELINIFESHGIKKMEPMGEKFDAHFHQAMFEAPNTGEADGTIVQVMQSGFIIKDRLLRPAMVGVAKGSDQDRASVDTTV
jgi:molecular chaperone GrpE